MAGILSLGEMVIDFLPGQEAGSYIRKPGGGRPGFVVYYTNYSLIADGREPKLEEKK